ncbi:MAG: hypothetical protein HYR72_08280 [Deltaproteobacteria bacterium]|nr:hypothetical protein [Deltaproteobacteria bacterium]MBI3386678.1 hypothetical protein [Deltaproteobacteria bacterium]
MRPPPDGEPAHGSDHGASGEFTDVAETLDTVAEEAVHLFACDATCVFVWDHVREELRPGSARGLSAGAQRAFKRSTLARGSSREVDGLLQNPAPIVTLEGAALIPGCALWAGWHSVHAVPLRLRYSGRLHGLACLFYRAPTPAAQLHNRAALEPWGVMAATAIALAQLAEYERAAALSAVTLADRLGESARSSELHEVLARLAQRALAGIPARACGVILRDPTTARLRLAAVAGVSNDFIAIVTQKAYPDHLPRNFPPEGHFTLEPTVLAEWFPIDLVADRVGRLLVMPVRVQTQVVGALAAITDHPETAFTAAQIDRTRQYAEQVGVAVEAARLFERTRILLDLAAVPPHPFERDAYLEAVARRARLALGATVCTVWLSDRAGRRLELAARAIDDHLRPRAGTARPPLVPVRAFAPWDAAPHASGPAVVAHTLPSESPLAVWAGSGPALLASLQAGDRVQGVIVVSGAGTAHHDARTLASIADVTALRLEQAQLHRDAAQHERELASHRERERIARDLHDTVLQTLVGISMQVGALQRRGQPVGNTDLAALQTALREQLLAMQGFVARLRHHDASAVDLLAEVQALAHEVTRRGQRVSVTGGALEAIPATIAHELVFLIREVLASAQQRQSPADVAVHLSIRDGHLCARLHFDSRRSTRREAWLPAVLRDRLALLGGHVRVTVQPRRGTTVSLRVPYRELAATAREQPATVPTVTARRASSARRT